MPKMATVSRMPLAIVSLPSESRGGFPELAAESAAFVKGFDAEHHPQLGADFEGIVRKVGEFGHHAPAADKIDIDRKSVVSGTSVSVRVDLGGRSIIKKKTQHHRQ